MAAGKRPSRKQSVLETRQRRAGNIGNVRVEDIECLEHQAGVEEPRPRCGMMPSGFSRWIASLPPKVMSRGNHRADLRRCRLPGIHRPPSRAAESDCGTRSCRGCPDTLGEKPSLVGSRTASRRRSTVIGRMTSRYFPRTYKSRRTSSAMPQMKLATQFSWPCSMSLAISQRILNPHRSVLLPVRQILGVQDLGPCGLGGLDHQGIPEGDLVPRF
jgi:hypothetical protein